MGETQTTLAQFTPAESALMRFAGDDSDVPEKSHLTVTYINHLNFPAARSDAAGVRLLVFHPAIYMYERPAVIEQIRDRTGTTRI